MGTDDIQQSSKPRRRKRWRSYGIRSLLILTTLTAVFLGWFFPLVAEQKQLLAVREKLSEKGATVTSEAVRWAPVRFCLSFIVEEDALLNCVEVRSQKLTNADLKLVGQLPFVKRLYLKHCPISYAGLSQLHSLKYLERLSLWGTPLVDDDFRGLNQIRSLKVLDIHNPRIGGYGSKLASDPERAWWLQGAFSRLPELKPEYKSQKRTAACLQHLRGLPNLRWLRFSFWLDDQGLDCLASMPRLNLSRIKIDRPTVNGLRHLPRWPELEWVAINAGDQSGDALAPLKFLPKLESLIVQDATVDESSLSHIAACQTLKMVSLQESTVTDAAAKQLGKLTKLVHANLLGTKVTADSIPPIVAIPTLEYLKVKTSLDDDAVIAIANATSLQSVSSALFLDPLDCYISEVGFKHLAKDLRIKWLRFHNPIAGENIPGIDVNRDQPQFQKQWLADLIKANPDYEGHCKVELGDFPLSFRHVLTKHAQLSTAWPISDYVSEDLLEMTAANILTHRYLTLRGEKDGDYRGLQINSSSLQKPSLRFLRHLPNLEVLEGDTRRFVGSPEDMWSNLKHLKQLKSLRLTSSVGGEATRHFGHLSALTKLECEVNADVSDADFEPLGSLANLEWMDLRIADVTQRKADAIGKLKNLKELILLGPSGDIRIGDLTFLQSLRNLRTLYIGGVGDADMDQLCQLFWIERLTISSARLSFSDAMKLLDLPKLKYVDIRSAVHYKTMTEAEFQQFQDAMKARGVHAR